MRSKGSDDLQLNRMNAPPNQITALFAVETSVFALIVLYKSLAIESPTLQTLLEAERAVSSNSLRISILIADNTPGGQNPGLLPEGVRYCAATDNPGLARPYNDALALAEKEGFTWLLTLDQDTQLPVNFFTAMDVHVKQYSADARIAAIVPRITDHGRLISPFRFVGGFLPWVLASKAKGISKRYTSALTSA